MWLLSVLSRGRCHVMLLLSVLSRRSNHVMWLLSVLSRGNSHEMLVFRVCGGRQNLYVISLYRNPDLEDDRIFESLLASMAAVQAEDIRASFLFLGHLNGHHQNWLGSTTTNRHGVAALTSQLSPVAISWLKVQPMHAVEHLTS